MTILANISHILVHEPTCRAMQPMLDSACKHDVNVGAAVVVAHIYASAFSSACKWTLCPTLTGSCQGGVSCTHVAGVLGFGIVHGGQDWYVHDETCHHNSVLESVR